MENAGVLGNRTWDRRMVDVDESTELVIAVPESFNLLLKWLFLY